MNLLTHPPQSGTLPIPSWVDVTNAARYELMVN
jgi:hypothetical protein